MAALLEIEDLHIFYGAIEALKGASLSLDQGEIVLQGISQVPEGRRVFTTLSVEENLNLGAYSRRRIRQEVQTAKQRVFALFPVLGQLRRQLAGTVSGGEQQMLAIGRALMCRPKVLLLDEPSLGLAPILVRQIFRIIREINDQGISILLVEQNAQKALTVAGRGYVLETGSIAASGTSAQLKADPRILPRGIGPAPQQGLNYYRLSRSECRPASSGMGTSLYLEIQSYQDYQDAVYTDDAIALREKTQLFQAIAIGTGVLGGHGKAGGTFLLAINPNLDRLQRRVDHLGAEIEKLRSESE